MSARPRREAAGKARVRLDDGGDASGAQRPSASASTAALVTPASAKPASRAQAGAMSARPMREAAGKARVRLDDDCSANGAQRPSACASTAASVTPASAKLASRAQGRDDQIKMNALIQLNTNPDFAATSELIRIMRNHGQPRLRAHEKLWEARPPWMVPLHAAEGLDTDSTWELAVACGDGRSNVITNIATGDPVTRALVLPHHTLSAHRSFELMAHARTVPLVPRRAGSHTDHSHSSRASAIP